MQAMPFDASLDAGVLRRAACIAGADRQSREIKETLFYEFVFFWAIRWLIGHNFSAALHWRARMQAMRRVASCIHEPKVNG